MGDANTSWHEIAVKRSSLQMGWLAIFLSCAFVLVALIGYTPADPTRLHPGQGEVTNPCGPVGANVADLLLTGFGYGAWSVFLGMAAAVLALAGRKLQPFHEWLLFFVGLAGACGVLAAVVPGGEHGYAPGGVVGRSVFRGLNPLLGDVGTLIVCTSIGLFSFVALFRISLQKVAARSVAASEQLIAWSGRALRGVVQRSLEGPATAPTTPPMVLPERPSSPSSPELLAVRRASPARLARRTPNPRPSFEGPLLDDELLPPMDPSDADVVFASTHAAEYDPPAYVPAARRGVTPRSVSPHSISPRIFPRSATPRRASPRPAVRRALVHHDPTPADVEPDSMLDLFPAVGPRNASRSARVGIVPTPSPAPPRPGEVGDRVVETLRGLLLYGRVTNVWEGPVVTTVGFRPERHIDPEAIVRRAGPIAEALGVPAVRVVAWAGTRDVGIEVPTAPRRSIPLDALLSVQPPVGVAVPVGLGVDVRGGPVFADLATTSHLAVVGQAGSGKSNALRAMVSSILVHPPDQGTALVLMTPESGVFEPFARRPELVHPVVRHAKTAKEVLRLVVKEIGRRRLAATPKGAVRRDHVALAPGSRSGSARQERWVVVVDRWNAFDAESSSLAPLVSTLVEEGSSVGVHLVIAMREPARFVRRPGPVGKLALALPSMEASRGFLGQGGAEALLGHGDALWLSPDGAPVRIHVPDAGTESLGFGHSLPPG